MWPVQIEMLYVYVQYTLSFENLVLKKDGNSMFILIVC